jgi:uncharacterized repeat protein (TIGR03803 family)
MNAARNAVRRRAWAGWVLATSISLWAGAACASEFAILHSFAGPDGSDPRSTLAIDAQGNLYGSTTLGGEDGEGTLFEIGAAGFATVHEFHFQDGGGPRGGLLIDADRNVWGTTEFGGEFFGGTAFVLDPSGSHRFASLSGGVGPVAGLTRGPDGSFYGVTAQGGFGQGGVFRLDSATLAVTMLHKFDGHDGRRPQGTLLSANGKLYGTAFGGGWQDRGTAFELNPDGSGFRAQRSYAGGWIECGLALDARGRAWGMAGVDRPLPGGEGLGAGGIFTIEPDGQVTIMHRFARDGSEGSLATAELVLGRDGWLYGMTLLSGAFGVGTIFRLNPDDSAFEVLHHFTGKKDDGGRPYATLTQDAAGVFYGTTSQGGTNGLGTVFRFVP